MVFELARYMPRDTPRDTVDEIDKYSYRILQICKGRQIGSRKRQKQADLQQAQLNEKDRSTAKRKLAFQTALLPGPNSLNIHSYRPTRESSLGGKIDSFSACSGQLLASTYGRLSRLSWPVQLASPPAHQS